MKIKKSKLTSALIKCTAAIVLGGIAGGAFADDTPYSNVFMSYMSIQGAKAVVDYAITNGSPSVFMWELRNDCGWTGSVSKCSADDSILKAMYTKANRNTKIAAYYTQWSTYGGSNKAPLDTLNSLAPYVDILYYGVLAPADYTGAAQVYSEDAGADSAAYKDLSAEPWQSKTKILSIGGAAYSNPRGTSADTGGYKGQNPFEIALSTTSNQNKLATDINDFLQSTTRNTAGFTGIDIDYEGPLSTNLTSFMSTLYNQLKGTKYMIILTIGANPDKIKAFGNDLKTISGQLNGGWINLMTYDYHGVFNATNFPNNTPPNDTGFLANLELYTATSITKGKTSIISPPAPPIKFSTKAAVEAAKSSGVDNNLISIGVPAYGRAIALPGSQSPQSPGIWVDLGTGTTVPGGWFESNDQAKCSNKIDSSYQTYFKDWTKTPSCTGTIPWNQIKTNMSDYLGVPWVTNTTGYVADSMFLPTIQLGGTDVEPG